jgi:uncharacterized protein
MGCTEGKIQHYRHIVNFTEAGRVNGRVLTVRYTQRGQSIRLIGAGYWREGREFYEKNAT